LCVLQKSRDFSFVVVFCIDTMLKLDLQFPNNEVRQMSCGRQLFEQLPLNKYCTFNAQML